MLSLHYFSKTLYFMNNKKKKKVQNLRIKIIMF